MTSPHCWTTERFTNDGRRLSFFHSAEANVESGKPLPRTAVAMLHGVLRSWNVFLPLTAHLSTRYDLWSLDQRGHGASDRAERYLVVDYVADAVAWLRGTFGRQGRVRPIVLYGHSLGAMVAAGVAAACPELVRGVVLEDPPFRTLGPHIGATNFHSYFEQIALLVRDRQASSTVAGLARRLAEITFVDPQSGRAQRLGDVRDAASLRFSAAALMHVDPHVLDPLVAGDWLDGYDEDAVFDGLKCPVLLLQADAALGGMLVDADVERLRARAADVTHLRMPGVGHMMHWQRTQEIANYTFSFIESLDGTTP
ncbi:MAG: alpha/beta hydrolase [Planctomycetia bacterium]|nr:alpha/beta hydrolase [Planctomycetia bacterium]